jgi:putative ABC transport system ATP-binding protein
VNDLALTEKYIEEIRIATGLGVVSDKQMLKSVLGIVGSVNITLQLIAAVSVLAAAFGIVNTMMSATYERKREIGILQAIGASRRTIFTLFIMESGFYGLIGGVTGALGGVATAAFATPYISQNAFTTLVRGSGNGNLLDIKVIAGSIILSAVLCWQDCIRHGGLRGLHRWRRSVMSDIIRIEQGAKRYKTGDITTTALRDVSLRIQPGSFTCIVGPSGHGKSTLMHLMGGLDSPTDGKVYIGDVEISRMANSDLARLRGKRVGFVFQFFNLLQGLTARENIEIAMMFAGLPEEEQRARAEKLLEQVGLSDKAGARPGQLSGGQQQRVAIARALANDPDILLMDEPTGNLDSVAEAEVLDLLQELHGNGKTVVIVTHSEEVARRAQRVIHVKDGAIAGPDQT